MTTPRPLTPLLLAASLLTGPALPHAAAAVGLSAFAAAAAPAAGAEHPWPDDIGGVFNVKEYGAVGDGVADDTAAIQAALQAAADLGRPHGDFSVVYLPDGEYKVSDTLSWRNYRTLQGQSREGTVIRLADGAEGFGGEKPKPVVRCLFNNNESIGNHVRDLTIDVGVGNPGAIGIRYNAHNQGIMEQVTIRSSDPEGAGRIGLDLSETEFGPGMIAHTRIEGFDTGIKTPGQPSHAVLHHIELRGQNVVGIQNHLPVSIHVLRSENAVPAIINRGPIAQLVLLDAELTGGDPAEPAIRNQGSAYLRSVSSEGYAGVLEDKGELHGASELDHHVSGTTVGPAGDHLNLPVPEFPEIFKEPASKWVKVGPPRNGDHTQAIQDAIDSGAETVYFEFRKTYHIRDTIVVRGNVKRLVSLHANISADHRTWPADKPLMRIEGNGKDPVTIESLGILAYPRDQQVCLELANAGPVFLRSARGMGYLHNTPEATGDVFMDEVLFRMVFKHPQKVWIRQLNAENNPYSTRQKEGVAHYLVAEGEGTDVWVLGQKTESPAVHAEAHDGARVEVLGGFFRDHFVTDDIPYFRATGGGELSASYLTYARGAGKSRELQADGGEGEGELKLPRKDIPVSLLRVGPDAPGADPS